MKDRVIGGLTVGIGLAVALVLTLAVFGLPVGPSLSQIGLGAFGDQYGIARTLVRAVPLTLCGLGVVVSWRAGMFSIGGEGQYLIGGISGAWAAQMALGHLPFALVTPMILVFACAGGAAYAWIAAWLSEKRGVQVVISTILLNFLAVEIVNFLVRGPLQEPKHQLPLTLTLPNDAMLQRFNAQTDLHAGIWAALAAAAAVWILMNRTKFGLILKTVGSNPGAARANRLNVSGTRIRAMMLSGLLCGLAGGVDYAGLTGKIGDGFSQNWGFMAIPAALLGGLNPLETGAAALFFGALFAGTASLARSTSVGTTVVFVVQATAVLAFISLQVLRARPKSEGAS